MCMLYLNKHGKIVGRRRVQGHKTLPTAWAIKQLQSLTKNEMLLYLFLLQHTDKDVYVLFTRQDLPFPWDKTTFARAVKGLQKKGYLRYMYVGKRKAYTAAILPPEEEKAIEETVYNKQQNLPLPPRVAEQREEVVPHRPPFEPDLHIELG